MKQTLLTLTLCTATLITFATANTLPEEYDGNGAFTLTFVLDWTEKNTILRDLKDNTIDHEIIPLFSLTDGNGNSKLSLEVEDQVNSGFVFGSGFVTTYTAFLQSVIKGDEGETVLSEAFVKTIYDGANSEIAALTVSYSYAKRTVGYYLRISYDKYETSFDTSTEVEVGSTADLSGLMKLTYNNALVKSVAYTEGAVDKDGAYELNAKYAPEKKLPEPTPSVPEPTTATLSLLALAGLAARRRRK